MAGIAELRIERREVPKLVEKTRSAQSAQKSLAPAKPLAVDQVAAVVHRPAAEPVNPQATLRPAAAVPSGPRASAFGEQKLTMTPKYGFLHFLGDATRVQSRADHESNTVGFSISGAGEDKVLRTRFQRPGPTGLFKEVALTRLIAEAKPAKLEIFLDADDLRVLADSKKLERTPIGVALARLGFTEMKLVVEGGEPMVVAKRAPKPEAKRPG